MKKILSILFLILGTSTTQAQIAYQVSLLNTATGEPRANETVNATITITNSSDETVYTTTQRATTNDFGVLSFAVGDANTFSNMDSGKFPLFISVTVNNVLIGKSQILNVPVAEYSKKLVSSFTKEGIVGTWQNIKRYYFNDTYEDYIYTYYINDGGVFTYTKEYKCGDTYTIDNLSGKYSIQGDVIYFIKIDTGSIDYAVLKDGCLFFGSTGKHTKQ